VAQPVERIARRALYRVLYRCTRAAARIACSKSLADNVNNPVGNGEEHS
jgi:hypothetical protein